MTDPSPAIQAEAERLLTLLPHEPGDEMIERRATRLVNEYVIFKRPAVAASLQALTDERDRLRHALETIEGACDAEIKKRFGGHSSMSIEDLAKGSRIYALLVLPRNVARTALNQPVPASTGETK